MLAYQLAVSIPMLALGMLLMGERMTAMPSAWSLGWLAYQTFWVVSLTYRGVVRHGAALFGEPSFGLHIPDPIVRGRSGHFVLGEPISWAFGAAVALVIAGLVLVNRPN